MVPEHQDLLGASKCPFVAGLFPPLPEAAKSSKFSSIGSRFKVLCFCDLGGYWCCFYLKIDYSQCIAFTSTSLSYFP